MYNVCGETVDWFVLKAVNMGAIINYTFTKCTSRACDPHLLYVHVSVVVLSSLFLNKEVVHRIFPDESMQLTNDLTGPVEYRARPASDGAC